MIINDFWNGEACCVIVRFCDKLASFIWIKKKFIFTFVESMNNQFFAETCFGIKILAFDSGKQYQY